MKNKTVSTGIDEMVIRQKKSYTLSEGKYLTVQKHYPAKAEILFISSYPPRECGIATYSQDLIRALNNKFSNSFAIKVCALESNGITYDYPSEVKYILKTSRAADYQKLSAKINQDDGHDQTDPEAEIAGTHGFSLPAHDDVAAARPGDTILTLGAGDVSKLADEVVRLLQPATGGKG